MDMLEDVVLILAGLAALGSGIWIVGSVLVMAAIAVASPFVWLFDRLRGQQIR